MSLADIADLIGARVGRAAPPEWRVRRAWPRSMDAGPGDVAFCAGARHAPMALRTTRAGACLLRERDRDACAAGPRAPFRGRAGAGVRAAGRDALSRTRCVRSRRFTPGIRPARPSTRRRGLKSARRSPRASSSGAGRDRHRHDDRPALHSSATVCASAAIARSVRTSRSPMPSSGTASSCRPGRGSGRTASASCRGARGHAKMRAARPRHRSGRCRDRRQCRRSIAARSTTRSSARARKSIISSRSPTTSSSGRHCLIAAQVGIAGSTHRRRLRRDRRAGRHRRTFDDRRGRAHCRQGGRAARCARRRADRRIAGAGPSPAWLREAARNHSRQRID